MKKAPPTIRSIDKNPQVIKAYGRLCTILVPKTAESIYLKTNEPKP